MATPYQFQATDIVDMRRFAGYPVYGTGAVILAFPWWFKYYEDFEVRWQNMTADEATVVLNTYLPNLRALETAIVGAGSNLDTDAAGPWQHNKDEVRDRQALFDDWRRRFCDFLGVPPGPGLRKTKSIRLRA